MPISNQEIAQKFTKLADLLEIEDSSYFRVRAYRNAVRIILTLQRDFAELVMQGEDLTQIPGIGAALAKKITTLVTTGELPALVEVEARVPSALSELMQIEGLGPKRIKQLFQELTIQSPDDLKKALEEGAVEKLPNFGSKITMRIKESLFGSIPMSIRQEQIEDLWEIQADPETTLTPLIELTDIRGDLHCKVNLNEKLEFLEPLIQSAIALGYEYLALTDNAKHLALTYGRNEKVILEQLNKIDKLQEKFPQIKLIKALELDMLENGSLDLSNEILKQLELTVCTIHAKFSLDKNTQTQRIIRAMDNPYFNILALPKNTIASKRHIYEIDMAEVILAAKARGCFVELNVRQEDADLNISYGRLAKQNQLRIALSTDAKSGGDLAKMQYGIVQAKKAWLESRDVINTYPLRELLRLLKRT